MPTLRYNPGMPEVLKREPDPRTLAQMLHDENLRYLALQGLKRCLNAERHYVVDGQVETETDFKTIALAAKVLIEYSDGPPTKYFEVQLKSGAKKGRTVEETNELIRRALRLPPGSEVRVIERMKARGEMPSDAQP